MRCKSGKGDCNLSESSPVSPTSEHAANHSPDNVEETVTISSDEEGIIAGFPRTVNELADRIAVELHKAVVGQEELVELLVVAILAGGHVLLEGVPGTAKTLSVRALA